MSIYHQTPRCVVFCVQANPVLKDGHRFRLLPLHSQLPTHEQRAVFDVPPQGVTKIVVSTNIAETSVTINDISVVIDAGTHKEMQYDPVCGMSCLREVRVSKANAAQRAGRAGAYRLLVAVFSIEIVYRTAVVVCGAVRHTLVCNLVQLSCVGRL